MPNTCWNKLRVIGPRPDVLRFRRRARGGTNMRPAHYAMFVDSPDESGLAPGPNPLDLDNLRPSDEESDLRLQRRLGQLYLDPKWNSWDVQVSRTKIDGAVARLEYSFMTAWCEPIGPIAHASEDYPDLLFVLAAVADDEFTTNLIRRGRVRRWEMPERTWQRMAEFEIYEGEEGEFFAANQPRIMEGLLAHWQKAEDRFLETRPGHALRPGTTSKPTGTR